jgi:diacylglycerol kinase (ATP)
MAVALVANERSGSNDPDQCAARLEAAGARVERFDIEELERAVETRPDRLVVAGGDGSIAGAAAVAGAAGIPLAVVAAGTANDFADRLGLPSDLAAACELAVRGSRMRELELGWINQERPFVNVASAGLPAPAARRAGSWKRLLGPLAYGLGALSAGLTAKPLRCLVDCDGGELLAGDAWQVTVAASGAFGAGAAIEEADPADGNLEVVAIEAGARLALVGLAYRLRRGRATDDPHAYHSSCTTAEVLVPEGTAFNVDGEVVCIGPARFTVEPRAFKLVVA